MVRGRFIFSFFVFFYDERFFFFKANQQNVKELLTRSSSPTRVAIVDVGRRGATIPFDSVAFELFFLSLAGGTSTWKDRRPNNR